MLHNLGGLAMNAHYRHTQTGWVILGVAAAIVTFGWTTVPEGGPLAPMLAIAALVALLFGVLTVEVDHEAVRLAFGVGLIRKRIPLRDVQSWREVRNPWYVGWGIRMGPGGVIWNVSGLDAVELALLEGKHFRIGTDEPEALAAAIARAKGTFPQTAASPMPLASSAGLPWLRWLPAIAVGAVLVLGLFWTQARPPGPVVGSFSLLAGYCRASLKRYERQVPDDFVRYLRSEQSARLRSVLFRKCPVKLAKQPADRTRGQMPVR